MNILQMNKYYPLIKKKQKKIEQAKFNYYSLGKVFEKQTKTIAD